MTRATEQLIAFAARHRRAVLVLLSVCGILSCLGLFRTGFTNDISQMFPDSEDAGATFRILRETGLANTVQLEFLCGENIEKHEKYLDSAAEKIAALPGMKNVVFRYRSDNPVDEIGGFSELIPRLFSPDILDGCRADEAAEKALKQMAFPVPGGVKFLRSRPYELDLPILQNLMDLDHLTGMRLAADLPWFASADKRRAMIVFDVDFAVGDADSVRKLVRDVKNAVAPLPQGMECRIISGAMHTLGNEEVLKRDAAISGTVSLMLFLIIFLVFYRRDWRTFWIPAVPLFASLLSLGIMTLFFREICLYVIGLGSCITGLAIDQGIHVYSAWRGKDAKHRTAALTEPMLLSAATSILVFVFLGSTGIRAYVQLAVFAGLSLAFSCILALIVLPLLLDRDRRIAEPDLPQSKRKFSAIPLLFLLPAAAVCGKFVFDRSDFSLDSMDGTPYEIRLQEEDFNKAWRSPRKTAVLAVSGGNREEALSRLSEIASELPRTHFSDPPEKKGIILALPPLPPQRKQLENLWKWRTPETSAKITELEEKTRQSCREKGLPEKFFQPFFDQLKRSISREKAEIPRILRYVETKMVKENGKAVSAVALLPDTEGNASVLRKILRKHGGNGALLSKEGFQLMIREDLGGRFVWILPVSILSALLLAYGVFRKFSEVMLAMVPVFSAFCGLLILGALTGFRATPAAAFALILLTGLAVDYGIYAVSELRHPSELSIRSPIVLSAATTVAGAGALIFSRHPVLFGTGVVLSAGIFLACLSGLYLVPMLKRTKTPKILPVLALLFLLTGCGVPGTPLENTPDADRLRRAVDLYPKTCFAVQANAGIEREGERIAVILAAELDPAGDHVRADGIHPGSGMKVFHLDETHRNDSWLPFSSGSAAEDGFAGWFRKKRMEGMGRALIEDFRRIFLMKSGIPLAQEPKTGYIAVYADDGTEWEIREGSVIRKRGSSWSCEYRDGGRSVLYRNHDGEYVIRLNIVKLAEKEKRDDRFDHK